MNTTYRQLRTRRSRQRSATLAAWWRTGIGSLCLLLATAAASPTQDGQSSPDVVKLKVLASFNGANGGNPESSVVQGLDGNFYGTTSHGGANNGGNVFKMAPNGSLTVLYDFCAQANCIDGSGPVGSLALGRDGNVYGTTYLGGAGGAGTVFKITPGGTFTTLYSFCTEANCADGNEPYGGLVLASDGSFYGTTVQGGTGVSCDPGGCGVVFKITRSGTLTVIYNFCSLPNCADGSGPNATVIQARDGNFYGTTQGGGAYGSGTAYMLSPKDALTTLHSFGTPPNYADGVNPLAPLVQAANGKFYGTSEGSVSPSWQVFELTPTGEFTTLYSFCAEPNCADGNWPSSLMQATDGNLYGITGNGGSNENCNFFGNPGCGTVFRMTLGGKLTTLHNFDGTDGEPALDLNYGLIQGTNGALYGTAIAGGINNSACFSGCGTAIGLYVGLGPFVEPLPTAGKVGATIKILGTNLTGATSVTFNGVAAVFNVHSKTLIEATVPAGATTGVVEVITPNGTLNSNVQFRVR